MYAVIFKAEINELDNSYFLMAKHMRELAISKYGCKEFTSALEDKCEISISYWNTEGQIREWKNDPEHLIAQEVGKSKWYKSYKVQIVKIAREYGSSI